MKSYKEPIKIEKEEFFDVMQLDDDNKKCDAVVNLVHSNYDYDWLLSQISSLLQEDSNELKRVGLISIGHIARLYENADREELINLVTPFLNEHVLSGFAEDALSDISMFCELH